MNKVFSFFQHPAVSILTAVATIISIPLGFYFYRASTRERDLSFYSHPQRTNVVSIGGHSQLKVSFADQVLKGNVTAVQIGIWNAGNQSILKNDVIQEITLTSSPPVRILETEIRKVTRGVSGFKIDETRNLEGILTFDWKVLESGDGAAIQILFEGDPRAQFTPTGHILEQKNITIVGGNDSDRASPEELRNRLRISAWGSVCLVGVLAIATLFWVPAGNPLRNPSLVTLTPYITMTVFAIMIYVTILRLTNPTPFDF